MSIRIFFYFVLAIAALLMACSKGCSKAQNGSAVIQKQPTPKDSLELFASDTALAGRYFANAEQFTKEAKYDSAIAYFEKASVFYEKAGDWEKYVRCYNQMGENCRRKADPEQAIRHLDRAAEVGLKNLGEQHLEMANNYNARGNVFYFNKGNYDQALDFYDKALSIRRKTLGEQHPEAGKSYSNIGMVQARKGQYKEALESHQKALSILLKALGESHPDLAVAYTNMGNMLMSQGKYDQALDFHNKVLSIRLAAFGEQHPDVAVTYTNMGNIYRRKGDYSRALDFHKKALSIRLTKLGEQHPEVARSYDNTGIIYMMKGDYDTALVCHKKALAIFVAALGEKHPDVAVGNTNMGIVYYSKGDYDQAIASHKKALSITLGSLGERHPNVANICNNIGVAYREKGDYDEALNFYNKALLVRLAIFGEQHPDVARVYNNIGVVHQDKGDYADALVFHEKTLSIRLATLGKDHLDVAECYGNLGNLCAEKADYDNAIAYYKKALPIFLKRLGEQHPFVAMIYDNLGVAYNKKGSNDQANVFNKKALSLRLAMFGERHPEVAMSYQNLGDVYDHIGRYNDALVFYQNALRANVPAFSEPDPYVNPPLDSILSENILLESLARKASTLVKRSTKAQTRLRDLEAAVSTYQHASRLIDQMRSSYKAEGSKLFLAEAATNIYDQGIQAARRLYAATHKHEHKAAAFLFAEKSKAGILLETFAEAEAKQFAGISDSLLEKERQIRIDLAFYEKSLIEEQLKLEAGDSAKIALWQDKAFNLRQAYDALLQRLEKEYPEYYKLKYEVKTVSLQEVQEQILNENTALVEYFTGKDSIFIFTITKSDFEVTAVTKDSLFGQQVKQLRQSIIAQDSLFAQYTQSAYHFYQTLLEAVANTLSAKNLIIIPDGVMSAIPFEALLTRPVNAEGGSKNYPKLPYLVEKYAISYGYSATLLGETLKSKRIQAERDYLAFAPVYFNGLAESTRGAKFIKSNFGLDTTRADIRANLGDLLASKDEVIGILEKFKATYGFFERWFSNKSHAFIEQQASEQRLKLSELNKYRFVHFATHGFVNETHPKLSGLLMPQVEASAEDGILYLAEVYNLSLNADLVILSACETGLGKIAKGEGIIGLTRGFLYAGARNLLVSLWQVDDPATAKLMVEFYGKMLDGLDKTEALREAKRQMIHHHPEYAKPYYWSSFILIGR
jgi:CHAT domain-containing protein/Tfp pilus assembly protein PilF